MGDDHPRWCAGAGCTADRPAFNGHPIGAHRSPAVPVGLTQIRLRQMPGEPIPSMELRRGDVVMVLPLGETAGLCPALADLLRVAGVRQ